MKSGLCLGVLVAGHFYLVGGKRGCVSGVWGMCAVGGAFGLVCVLGYLWPLVCGFRFVMGSTAVSWCLPESVGLWAVRFGALLCQKRVRHRRCFLRSRLRWRHRHCPRRYVSYCRCRCWVFVQLSMILG